MEFVEIKNQNHLYKSIRNLQKEKQDFAVLFTSQWDNRSDYVLRSLMKANKATQLQEKQSGVVVAEKISTVLLIDSFEVPELFSSSDRMMPCTTIPVCYFYQKDNRIREYKIFRESLPSRILGCFDIFE